MKILHLIQTSGPGGAEKIVLDIVTDINREIISCAVGTLRRGWLTDRLHDAGIDYEILEAGRSIDFKLIKNIVRLAVKKKVDLIHSHLLDMNFYSSIAAKVARIPHIGTEHGDISLAKNKSFKNRIKANITLRLSNKLVCVSRSVQDDLLKVSPIIHSKTVIIHNGIDTHKFCPISKDERDRLKRTALGLKKNTLVVLNVANLYPVKGQNILLQSFKYVNDMFPNTRLLIVGRGGMACDLAKMARDLGIAESVQFLGFREDIATLMKISDIFVLPSLSEGLPLSLIEGMACGLAPIASRVGGIPEVLKNGLNGLLVQPGNKDELARKMLVLVREHNVRHKFSGLARDRVVREFSLKSMMKKYMILYQEQIKKASRVKVRNP